MVSNGSDTHTFGSECARIRSNMVSDITRLTRLPCLNKAIGLSREQVMDDPQLNGKCRQLVVEAASRLAAPDIRMIAFDHTSETLIITELGRIAAKYYIRYASIEIFNQQFQPRMSEADVLAVLSKSTEVRG